MKNQNFLRSLAGLPTLNSLSGLQRKAQSQIKSTWTNVELEDGSLYNGFQEFIYFINHAQDTVEQGLPAQIQIYCDIDDDEIRVARLSETYVEDDGDEMEWEDLEEHTFSWKTLSDLLVKYQPATY